jgi:hypothetical protein
MDAGKVYSQKHVVQLIPERKKDKDGKSIPKTLVGPVVSWLLVPESRHVHRWPCPPGTLKEYDGSKGYSRPDTVGDGSPIQPCLYEVALLRELRGVR